jgi:exodeoxyribonuclease V alpha subunit
MIGEKYMEDTFLLNFVYKKDGLLHFKDKMNKYYILEEKNPKNYIYNRQYLVKGISKEDLDKSLAGKTNYKIIENYNNLDNLIKTAPQTGTKTLSKEELIEIKEIFSDFYNFENPDIFSVFLYRPKRFYSALKKINFQTNSKKKNFSRSFEAFFSKEKEEKNLEKLILNILYESGSTFIEKNHLQEIIEKGKFKENLESLDKDKFILLDDRIYYLDFYKAEKSIAENLCKIDRNFKDKVDVKKLDQIIKKLERKDGKLDPYQKQAVKNVFKKGVTLISGSPGTGKTSTVKYIVEAYKDYYKTDKIVLTSFTGKASVKLMEKTGRIASTAHSIFLAKEGKEKNTNNFEEKNLDLLLIDEASILDIESFYRLLSHFSSIKSICIIGDINQIASIKPGQLFKDLVESKKFLTVFLEKNHRNEDGRDIIDLCKHIFDKEGKISDQKQIIDKHFIESDCIYQTLKKCIEEDLASGKFDMNNICILSSLKNSYELSTSSLNFKLQNDFSSFLDQDAFVEGKNNRFFIGDPVIQIKNDYKNKNRPIMNGEEAKVIDLESKNDNFSYQDRLSLEYQDGTRKEYVGSDIDNFIDLSYAITIHKSQGSEYDKVYILIDKYLAKLMNKNMWYTAISRAKKDFVIIGDRRRFDLSLSRGEGPRKTALKNILQENY